MEIRTRTENRKIKTINENIYELEQIEELKLDLTTPNVYEYKLSKKENVVESISMILVLLVAILLLFTDYYFLSVVLLLLIAKDLKNLKYLVSAFTCSDNLKISEEGIYMGSKGFIKWGDIKDLSIDHEERLLLVNYCKESNETKAQFDLWRLESYDFIEFNKMLKLFVERYEIDFID